MEFFLALFLVHGLRYLVMEIAELLIAFIRATRKVRDEIRRMKSGK